MISSIEISNFYSIKKPINLSLDFKTNKSRSFQENVIYKYKDQKGHSRSILDGALIYGANASGKSNILKAFDFIHDIITNPNEIKNKENVRNIAVPFLITDSINEVSQITLTLVIKGNTDNDIKVKYNLKYNCKNKEVVSEKLTYRNILRTKLSDEVNIFTRRVNTIIKDKSTKKLKKIFNKISKENIKYNSLFFYLINDINYDFYKNEVESKDYNIIMDFFNEVQNGLLSVKENNESNYKLAKKIKEDIKFKKELIAQLNDFDFSISDIKIHENNISKLIKELKDKGMEENLIKFISESNRFSIKTIHNSKNNKIPLNIFSESDGTQRFLYESLHVNKSIINNCAYIKDEFDSKYHIKIQESILNMFKPYGENRFSQFIITSQNPLLLNPNEWAKEQIKFVSKNRRDQSTSVYQLSDFKDISYNNHNWMRLYLDGRFGAIPEVLD